VSSYWVDNIGRGGLVGKAAGSAPGLNYGSRVYVVVQEGLRLLANYAVPRSHAAELSLGIATAPMINVLPQMNAGAAICDGSLSRPPRQVRLVIVCRMCDAALPAASWAVSWEVFKTGYRGRWTRWNN
jgi:hypothetical protein